ncbi:MAG: hypothetical protein WA432_01640 [Candidatus Babeliaceae bacterium]
MKIHVYSLMLGLLIVPAGRLQASMRTGFGQIGTGITNVAGSAGSIDGLVGSGQIVGGNLEVVAAPYNATPFARKYGYNEHKHIPGRHRSRCGYNKENYCRKHACRA